MVDLRFVLTAVLSLVAIAVPAYAVAALLNPFLGVIVAISMALGIGGGRWLATKFGGGGGQQRSTGRTQGRQSKGARGGDRR